MESSAELYAGADPDQQSVQWLHGSGGVMVLGAKGAGKTRILCGLACEAVGRGQRVRVVEMSGDMGHELEGHGARVWYPEDGDRWWDPAQPLVCCDLGGWCEAGALREQAERVCARVLEDCLALRSVPVLVVIDDAERVFARGVPETLSFLARSAGFGLARMAIAGRSLYGMARLGTAMSVLVAACETRVEVSPALSSPAREIVASTPQGMVRGLLSAPCPCVTGWRMAPAV